MAIQMSRAERKRTLLRIYYGDTSPEAQLAGLRAGVLAIDASTGEFVHVPIDSSDFHSLGHEPEQGS